MSLLRHFVSMACGRERGRFDRARHIPPEIVEEEMVQTVPEHAAGVVGCDRQSSRVNYDTFQHDRDPSTDKRCHSAGAGGASQY